MAITHFPDDLKPRKTVACAICRSSVTLDKATVGFLDASGQQTFACNAHFWEGNKFILGWVDFAAKERLRSLNGGFDSARIVSLGDIHVWPLS